MTHSAFFCPLIHEGLLAVRGPDATKFLQGQVTCNLNYLGAEHSSLGARCTPKGRMLSSFRVVPEGDGFLLAMATELLETQQAELKKYAVFSKVRLDDESAAWTRIGLAGADALLDELALRPGEDAGQVVRDGQRLGIRLDARRVELWVPAPERDDLLARLAAHRLPEAPLNDWLLAQVRAGVGQVFGPTRELFVPQMINLQAVGGVSFKKGCYTGQEIVARMQYLGKLKRRLYRLKLAQGEPPAIGAPLYSPVHATAVGEVVLAAVAGDDTVELLAVLQEDALGDGRVTLGAPEGPRLEPLDLPYTLDADREIQR